MLPRQVPKERDQAIDDQAEDPDEPYKLPDGQRDLVMQEYDRDRQGDPHQEPSKTTHVSNTATYS